MIASVLESARWKARRWLAAFASIFLLQFLFIYFLSTRSPSTPGSLSRSFHLQIFSAPWTEAKFSKIFLESDPALFAIPGTHGFSGAAWLKDPVRDYEAGNLFEQKEPPFWLTLNVGQLGDSIGQFVRTNRAAPGLRREDSAPKIQIRLLAVADETKTNSQLRVEGQLAGREMISSAELASWPHTNLLSNSIAEVAVDQNGMVISARLLSKSGLEKADRSAMETARLAQFSRDRRSIAWGTLIFDWHTLPMESTNSTDKPKSP